MANYRKAVMVWLEEERKEEEMEEEALAALAVSVQETRSRPRRWWIHPLNQTRLVDSSYFRLQAHLDLDGEIFKGYFRLSKEQFIEVSSKLQNALRKQDTRMRSAITPQERLAVTLRFLATGETFQSLAYSYRMRRSTISTIVKEVCEVIWQILQPEVMKVPSTQEDWRDIANTFERTWQFPNCCGAIDGKHVVIQATDGSGSLYYNYKGTFSIVLLAVVDAGYKFVMIDVGSCGMNNDAGVFRNSKFGQALRNGKVPLPEDRPLPGAEDIGPLPYVFIADEGLPLLRNIMRPYERVFNYRLSRARRMVESAFGILATRWRVFHTKILTDPDLTKSVVKAACVLHNYMQSYTTQTELISHEELLDSCSQLVSLARQN